MKKDLMIGVFSNLPFAAVAPWLRSVHACGFTGDKVIVAIVCDRGDRYFSTGVFNPPS